MNLENSENDLHHPRNHPTEESMKNVPKTIFLNFGPINGDEDFAELREVTWSENRINETDQEYLRMPITDNWAELNATLLVNFLRLPEEHQRHLAESMMAKRPDVFPNYWQQRCKLAEKYLSAVPIDHRQWSSTSAEHHKQMYHEFIRDNQGAK